MIASDRIAEAVRTAIVEAAVTLRPDVAEALERALESERSERGRVVLAQLIENSRLAAAEALPLCQDTGTVQIRLEFGGGECVPEGLYDAVNAAVAQAYRSAGLRMSVVADALLERTNTGDNTPAFLEIVQRRESGVSVEVMLKGGGSDNASRLEMLPPGAGWDGVREVVLDAVRAKGASACPPLLVAVGVGSTFDKVGSLAKQGLWRSIGSPPADVRLTRFESELLESVNSTGIGPAGLGGDTTALAVHLTTAPCHIAALPVAVNMGCSAIRSARVELV